LECWDKSAGRIKKQLQFEFRGDTCNISVKAHVMNSSSMYPHFR